MPRPSKLKLPFDPKQIGGRVQYAIDEDGRSLSEVAFDSGIDKGKLSRVTNGKAALNFAEIVRICDTLGIRAGWLIDGEDPMERGSVAPMRLVVKMPKNRTKAPSEGADGPALTRNG